LTPIPELPIWIAATGDLTTQVVAEAADGWYPLFLTLLNLRSRGDEIASASGESKPVTVAAGPFVVAGPGARDIAAGCLAWYICAMGEGYAKLIADQGYGDAVEAIISANPRPTPTNSTVPESANDALVAFMVFRTPEEVRHNLEPWKVAQTCSWLSSSPECHGRTSKQRCVQSPTNKLRRAPRLRLVPSAQ
jgi:alkanesulfonate monooxygenase SsuD/methylene tetrahydromethanopterin reductase-like flavin-dependent oxidoreductase (luciferase family)